MIGPSPPVLTHHPKIMMLNTVPHSASVTMPQVKTLVPAVSNEIYNSSVVNRKKVLNGAW
jgi:hypothetical protein